MTLVRKTYVEFSLPGVFFSEGLVREVKTRDIARLRVPKDAFAYYFFDVLTESVEDQGKKVTLTSPHINISPRYFYGGKVFTLDELKNEYPKETTLIINVEFSNTQKAILCRTGNWQIFEKNDVLVEIPSK